MTALRLPLTLCAALVLVAGCGGSQPPIGASGAMLQTSAIAQHASHGKSWMLPEAKAEKLVYIAAGQIYVYAYRSSKLVGTIARIGDTHYECSDKQGNVFVSVDQFASNTGIYEYAHGGTNPINYFSVPEAFACAVDPITGNLAVINGGPTIYIFPNASGSPEVYTASNIYYTRGIAYDGSSNLFINGSDIKGHFALVELPAGGNDFESITIAGSEGGNALNPLAWDGQYLALGSYQSTKKIHDQEVVLRLAISGSSAEIVGNTPLGAQREPYHLQFWANGNVAIQASNKPRSHSLVQYFTYPEGKATKTLRVPPLGAPYGITVSE